MNSMYNSRSKEYKQPFGAAAAGQPVQFTIRIPADIKCTTPHFVIKQDGKEPEALLMQAAGHQDGEDVFMFTYTPKKAGLYFYWFDLWTEWRKLYSTPAGTAVISVEPGRAWQLTVYDPGFTTPAQVRGAVMYQIFPDRFFEGDEHKSLVFNERIYRPDKRKEPYFWPDNMENGYLTRDYFGGDLLGIELKLPFLKVLGVTYIYLNPIFEAHSNHRYNTADYCKIDPYLGTNEDFVRLCRTAAEMGIRIILDGVFSHTGSDSVYFNKEGRYPSYGAWQGPDSKYRSWFNFNPDGSYASWWGFLTLPECNKQDAGFREFICGEGGVIDQWLQMGAAGFRLDVADELPDDFIALIRTAVKRNGDDKLLIGEVWEDASAKEAYGVRRKYFQGHELDGVMNYPFRDAIITYMRTHDAAGFANAVMSICENYPPQALAACTTHLSTHDTVRIITELAGEPVDGHDRNWQSGRSLTPEQYHLGIVRLQLAFVLQFTLPGIPCVYYGDEIAMQGYKDPFNRAYYDWNSGESHLIPLMIKLAALRKNCPAFAYGDMQILHAEKSLLIFERTCENSRAAVAINCSSWHAAGTMLGENVIIPSMGYEIKTL